MGIREYSKHIYIRRKPNPQRLYVKYPIKIKIKGKEIVRSLTKVN